MPFVNRSATGSLQTWPRRSTARQRKIIAILCICCATPRTRFVVSVWHCQRMGAGLRLQAIPGGRVGLRVHTDRPIATSSTSPSSRWQADRRRSGQCAQRPGRTGQSDGPEIQNASFAATEATPRFRPFTASELAKLTTELEYGDSGIIDSMFEEKNLANVQRLKEGGCPAVRCHEGASTVPGASRQGSAGRRLSQQLPGGFEPALQTADWSMTASAARASSVQ